MSGSAPEPDIKYVWLSSPEPDIKYVWFLCLTHLGRPEPDIKYALFSRKKTKPDKNVGKLATRQGFLKDLGTAQGEVAMSSRSNHRCWIAAAVLLLV